MPLHPNLRQFRVTANNPLLHQLPAAQCPACGEYLVLGDFYTLVPIGPSPDPEERRKARNGRCYDAVALPVHWACATGEEEVSIGRPC